MHWLDNLAHTLVEWSGKGFDPNGCTLPAFKPKHEPRAALPKREKKPVEVRDDGLLTDEEMKDWRYYGTGKESDGRIKQALKDVKTSKAVHIDFDETPDDMHGITEREYGEMRAYNPPLLNLTIAAIVKAERAKGSKKKTWAQVAIETRQTEQMIKHYSSALEKANPSPAKK